MTDKQLAALGKRLNVPQGKRWILPDPAYLSTDQARMLLAEVERLRAENLDLYRALEAVLKATDAAQAALVAHPVSGVAALQAVHAAQSAAFGALMKQTSDEAHALLARKAQALPTEGGTTL